jgi:hypothetical protein
MFFYSHLNCFRSVTDIRYRGGRGLRYQIKLADVGGRIVKTRRQTTCGGRPKKKTKKPAAENCRDFEICSRPARAREAHEVGLNSRFFATSGEWQETPRTLQNE